MGYPKLESAMSLYNYFFFLFCTVLWNTKWVLFSPKFLPLQGVKPVVSLYLVLRLPMMADHILKVSQDKWKGRIDTTPRSNECEGGGGALVISLGLIPWEQMVNGGLPRCLESKQLACVHVARSNTGFEEEEDLMRQNRKQTGEKNGQNCALIRSLFHSGLMILLLKSTYCMGGQGWWYCSANQYHNASSSASSYFEVLMQTHLVLLFFSSIESTTTQLVSFKSFH